MGKRDKAAKAKASNGKSALPARSAMPKRKGRGGSGGGYKAEDFQDLVSQLKPLGLNVLKMDADGNCLFRSVADQLCGDAEEHQSYRERCCEHMLDHAEEFSLFCVADDFESGCDSFESYVSKMERPGTWGSQLELMAICQSYGVNAIVHQSGLPSYEMVFSPEENQCMQISYHDGEHFNSVRFAWDMEGPVKHLSLAQLKGKSEKLKDLVEQVKYSLPPEHGFDDMLMRQVIVEAKEDVDLAVELLLKKMAKTEDPVVESGDPSVPEAKDPKDPEVAVNTSGSGLGYSEAAPPGPSVTSVPASSKPRAEKRQERKAKAEAKKKATKATRELKDDGEPDQEAMKQLLCKQLLSV